MNDQAQLLATSFGLGAAKSLAYGIGFSKVLTQPNNNEKAFSINPFAPYSPGGLQPVAITKADLLDQMMFPGAVVYSALELIDPEGNVPNAKFPLCIFSPQQATIVIESRVQGRAGSIKEYIAPDDWILDIKLLIPGNNYAYPKQAVSNLLAMCSLPYALQIVSEFVNDCLGVTNIVVYDKRCPQNETRPFEQPFEINCKSDIPFQLFLSP